MSWKQQYRKKYYHVDKSWQTPLDPESGEPWGPNAFEKITTRINNKNDQINSLNNSITNAQQELQEVTEQMDAQGSELVAERAKVVAKNGQIQNKELLIQNQIQEITNYKRIIQEKNDEISILKEERDKLLREKELLIEQKNKLKAGADKLLSHNFDLANKTRKSKEKHYNLSTELIESQQTNKLLSNILEKNQIKELKHNKAHKRALKNDLNLASKRIKIKENDNRKRLYYIFLLKHIFSYSLLSLLLTMFMRNGVISKTTATYSIIILTIGLFIVLLLNYYFNRLRNVNYFYKHDFPKPEKEVAAPSINKCI